MKSTQRVVRRTIKARRTSIPPSRHASSSSTSGGSIAQLLRKLAGAGERLEQSRRPMRRR